MPAKVTSGEELRWNSDTTYALGLYRTLGRSLGIWPLNYFDIFSHMQVAFIAIMQLWMSIDLIQQLAIKGNCGTPTELVDVVAVTVSGIVTSLKVTIPKILEHYFYSIVNSAVEDWARVMDGKSRRIMLKYANIGRTVFIIQIIIAFATAISLFFTRLPFIMPFESDQTNTSIARRFIVGPTCWISPNLSTFTYISYYSAQFLQIILLCNGNVGSDAYFFGIAMHVCGQFELLHMNIKNLNKIKDHVNQRHEIIQFSKRHEHLLILAKNFEKIYNFLILVQVGVDTIVICTSGVILLATARSLDFITIGGLLMRIYLNSMELFMYSYVGEKLSKQARKLQDAIYNISWYNMAPDLVRDMSFIIMKCNYPFNLTAGKIYVMNLSNFISILKAMGSYFSILRLMIINQ